MLEPPLEDDEVDDDELDEPELLLICPLDVPGVLATVLADDEPFGENDTPPQATRPAASATIEMRIIRDLILTPSVYVIDR